MLTRGEESVINSNPLWKTVTRAVGNLSFVKMIMLEKSIDGRQFILIGDSDWMDGEKDTNTHKVRFLKYVRWTLRVGVWVNVNLSMVDEVNAWCV